MEYNEFIEIIKDRLEEICGEEFLINVANNMKNNSVMFRGISIREKGARIAPTIYLEDFYTDHCDGREIEDIINDILRIYSANRKGPDFDPDSFSDYEWVKSRIFYKVINAKDNAELLSRSPHYRFLDLAVIYCVMAGDYEGTISSVTIRNEHINMWGVDEMQIREQAIKNAPGMLPASIVSLTRMISDMTEEDIPESECIPMYVLTNKIRTNGASAILYKGVLEDFAENIRSDLYILPSSVHEVILVPDMKELDPKSLVSMIKEVNDTQVSAEEILSYSLYRYSRSDKTIDIVDPIKKVASA